MAEKDRVTMSQRELRRLHFVKNAIGKVITQAEAAEAIEISERQVRRIVRKVEEDEPAAELEVAPLASALGRDEECRSVGAAELGHFPLGLALSRRCSEALGESLTFDLVGQPEVGAMAGFAWLMAMAVGVSAPSLRRGN